MIEAITKIILLAAFSDGELQPSELELFDTLKERNRIFNSLTVELETGIINDLRKKFNSGFSEEVIINSILDESASLLDKESQQTAFALAAEICASNYVIIPMEHIFLINAQQKLAISDEDAKTVYRSIELRYGNIRDR